MNSLNIGMSSKIPSKIYCIGNKYDKTKALSIYELALMIEVDLVKLANKYYELAAHFEVSCNLNKRAKSSEISIKLLSNHPDALQILFDEIERVLWSYNKQILVQSGGRFSTRYSRFDYTVDFAPRTSSIVKT